MTYKQLVPKHNPQSRESAVMSWENVILTERTINVVFRGTRYRFATRSKTLYLDTPTGVFYAIYDPAIFAPAVDAIEDLLCCALEIATKNLLYRVSGVELDSTGVVYYTVQKLSEPHLKAGGGQWSPRKVWAKQVADHDVRKWLV